MTVVLCFFSPLDDVHDITFSLMFFTFFSEACLHDGVCFLWSYGFYQDSFLSIEISDDGVVYLYQGVGLEIQKLRCLRILLFLYNYSVPGMSVSIAWL